MKPPNHPSNRPPPRTPAPSSKRAEDPKPAAEKSDRSAQSDKALARIAGFSAVSALFAAAPERVERLFFDEKSAPRAKDFCQFMAKARKPYRLVPRQELDKIAGTPIHGGIVAVAQPRPVLPFDPEAAKSWASDGRPLLILDGVGNPHNLGAIMRTTAFFGLPRVVLSDHPQQAMPSDASYRVSEGGFEHIDVYRATKFSEQLAKLRGAYRIIGAAPGGKSSVPVRRKGEPPFALLLGNEEHGLPKTSLDVCDNIVAIEGAGKVESLNVSAAAAILIHALAQK
ncbi:MAG TPA: TrmH family RNA methyltransferase [Hyphomonadaceae bacterium]|nr:TrmH family RNA methyltransferase [Hyphomonadaceae bacterium]